MADDLTPQQQLRAYELALREMLKWFGCPGREEWLNDESFEQAKQVVERARDVLAGAAKPGSAWPSEEQVAWALCCGTPHCNAASHADDRSPDRYAQDNCEGKEITEQARRVLTLLRKGEGR